MIEYNMGVTKVADVKADMDRTFTVTLKGVKTIVHEKNGYELEDTAEITITVKCEMLETLRKLGISDTGMTKIMAMWDRDMQLQSFEDPVPVAQRGLE